MSASWNVSPNGSTTYQKWQHQLRTLYPNTQACGGILGLTLTQDDSLGGIDTYWDCGLFISDVMHSYPLHLTKRFLVGWEARG